MQYNYVIFYEKWNISFKNRIINNMKWREIEESYPDSYNRFVECMFPNLGVISVSTLEYFDIKKLYKFFDDQGVFLIIEMYRPKQWQFLVSFDNGIVFTPKSESKKSRQEIEIEGFIECFRLLDKIIKDRK